MSLISPERVIEAVLFDLDGTLVLSEDRTDAAVRAHQAVVDLLVDGLTNKNTFRSLV